MNKYYVEKQSPYNIMTQSYCTRCRVKTADKSPHKETAKNGQPMVKSLCAECGTRKARFVSRGNQGGRLTESNRPNYHLMNDANLLEAYRQAIYDDLEQDTRATANRVARIKAILLDRGFTEGELQEFIGVPMIPIDGDGFQDFFQSAKRKGEKGIALTNAHNYAVKNNIERLPGTLLKARYTKDGDFIADVKREHNRAKKRFMHSWKNYD